MPKFVRCWLLTVLPRALANYNSFPGLLPLGYFSKHFDRSSLGYNCCRNQRGATAAASCCTHHTEVATLVRSHSWCSIFVRITRTQSNPSFSRSCCIVAEGNLAVNCTSWDRIVRCSACLIHSSYCCSSAAVDRCKRTSLVVARFAAISFTDFNLSIKAIPPTQASKFTELRPARHKLPAFSQLGQDLLKLPSIARMHSSLQGLAVFLFLVRARVLGSQVTFSESKFPFSVQPF